MNNISIPSLRLSTWNLTAPSPQPGKRGAEYERQCPEEYLCTFTALVRQLYSFNLPKGFLGWVCIFIPQRIIG